MNITFLIIANLKKITIKFLSRTGLLIKILGLVCLYFGHTYEIQDKNRKSIQALFYKSFCFTII